MRVLRDQAVPNGLLNIRPGGIGQGSDCTSFHSAIAASEIKLNAQVLLIVFLIRILCPTAIKCAGSQNYSSRNENSSLAEETLN